MKKLIFIFLLNMLHLSAAIHVIPVPAKIIEKEGFLMVDDVRINTIGFEKVPLNLIDFAEEIFQCKKQSQQEANNAKIVLSLQLDKRFDIPMEGYCLSIDKDCILLKSNTEAGIFYGLQTLMQITSVCQSTNKISIPLLTIEDYPRFAYRGLSLDVGRHLFPITFIKQYIDLMSQYKLNSFHWHLTEDQGWRIEIKKYPKLTEVGGYRDQTLIGHGKDKQKQFDDTRYGGYYTQEEVKEIVAYAASKYITVIPEIEMPGHSLAALSSYPELGCGEAPGPYKVAQQWGIFDDVYCAGKEKTFEFVENVLDEVIALFPSKYIHIGGDECPKTKWKTCPHCQARIKNQKLNDEHELQSYFINRIEKYLNKKGRQIIGWDEILEGGLAPNATVMSWRGVKGGIDAANQKHEVIMTPDTYLYFDHKESKSPEEPITIGGYLPLRNVYDYNPLSGELPPDKYHYVKGVQANIWTEYMKTPEKVCYMMMPRLFALSEIAWSLPENKDWNEFSEKTLPIHLADIDKKGFTYRVPEPIGAIDTTIFASEYELDLKVPVAGAKIYYTINGYHPREVDYLFTQKIKFRISEGEERIIKSIVITPSNRKSNVITTVVKNKHMLNK